ncbi:MAG: AIR synthase family protein [Anaerolineae bacterium]|nr:AIR synthase family protein [Anaerolineae bacterium]
MDRLQERSEDVSIYPLGKLPVNDLTRLLSKYPCPDPRLVVRPAIGEDAAVIDMGDRYLVVATDPITFATDEIGWYAVNVNANDIACTGAVPRWFLATLLLPEKQTGPALVDQIFAQIHSACTTLRITLIGGHTEITHGLDRPIVVGQMLGEVAPDKMVRTGSAQVGDDLILTKGIAIEATAIIATEMRSDLQEYFDDDSLNHYANFLHEPGISVVKDAAIAISVGGVHAMHDPTEGGVASGLHELAEASNIGLEIWANQLPYLPATIALCQHFHLNPLGVIASGALLIAADPKVSGKIVSRLRKSNIAARVIGRVTPPEQGRLLIDGDRPHPLPGFARDEITRLFA